MAIKRTIYEKCLLCGETTARVDGQYVVYTPCRLCPKPPGPPAPPRRFRLDEVNYFQVLPAYSILPDPDQHAEEQANEMP
jgi:hypothetical protein